MKETIINVPWSQGGFADGNTYQALLNLPSDYATATNKKYPLLVFLHGSGESNAPISNIYNNANAGGPAYFIEAGLWPANFLNPATGLTEEFIILSPQAVGTAWSESSPSLDWTIQYMVINYRVDPNRISLTGLSAGGAGIVAYGGQMNSNTGAPYVPKFSPCSMVPMSEAGGAPTPTLGSTIVSAGTNVWGFGDPVNDPHGLNTELLLNEIKVANPNFGRFTSYSGGHSGWGAFYNPNYTETIGGKAINIYQWMLQFALGTVVPPPVNPPPVTTPRTVTGVQININGDMTPIPVSGCKFSFSDGGTQ